MEPAGGDIAISWHCWPPSAARKRLGIEFPGVAVLSCYTCPVSLPRYGFWETTWASLTGRALLQITPVPENTSWPFWWAVTALVFTPSTKYSSLRAELAATQCMVIMQPEWFGLKFGAAEGGLQGTELQQDPNWHFLFTAVRLGWLA